MNDSTRGKGEKMELSEAIERTKNWGVTYNPDGSRSIKMKLSFEGSIRNAVSSDGKDMCGAEELIRFFQIAKQAWLNGDLETVSDYFGILV